MLRWGFVGSGSITRRVLKDFNKLGDTRVCGVCSRTRENAEKLAREYQIPNVYNNLDDMIQGGKVNAIYVALTHPQHFAPALTALKAGLPVLCEKPLTVDYASACALADASRQNKTFLMEAFWTRFFPAAITAREWIHQGRIGELCAITGILSYPGSDDPASRGLNPYEAGGALLDIGCYLVNFSNYLTGQSPVKSVILSNRHPACNADRDDAFVLQYPSGVLASLVCSVKAQSGDPMRLIGSKGYIEFPAKFNCPQTALLYNNDKLTERYESLHPDGEGFDYEFAHVDECVSKKLIESPIMPLSDTLANMSVLDELRRQIDLVYPFEE
jgi:predicted dehydrogenase